jgi:Fic family protein
LDFYEIDRLKNELDKFRPLSPELMDAIAKKFKIEWTYNSNALEGNTLTLQETSFFLQHGLTSKGKPLKDYLEAQNHAEAIDWIKEIVKNNRPITEGLIKEFHALLFKGIEHIWVGPQENRVKKNITPGKYKTEPNYVVNLEGEIHYYCDPIKVPEEMERLVEMINKSKYHPVELSARAHYGLVAIHPFNDGNGRVARLLMNLILIKNGFLPVIIKTDKKEDYYAALMKADRGNIYDFIQLVAEEEKNSLYMVLDIIKKKKQDCRLK